MSRNCPSAAGVLLLCLPLGDALAWGTLGHRVSARVAQHCLTPEAQAAVQSLLGQESLAQASTWADFMRSSDSPFWRRAAPYHYVTVPAGERYDRTKTPVGGDAVTALAKFRDTLRNASAPRDSQIRALRFAVHIIADLHQPLHVGNGKDRGGNHYPVYFFDRPTNLHRVWDVHLPEHEALSSTQMSRWLVRNLEPAQVARWASAKPERWIDESLALREQLYPPRNARLGEAYAYEHRDAVRRRLTQGGVRTAAWLHTTFAVTPQAQAARAVSCFDVSTSRR